MIIGPVGEYGGMIIRPHEYTIKEKEVAGIPICRFHCGNKYFQKAENTMHNAPAENLCQQERVHDQWSIL